MERLQFSGQSLRDDDHTQGNTSRLINWYRSPQGGMASHQCKQVMGTEALVTFPELFTRAIREVSGRLYAQVGDKLYDVRENGSTNVLATVPNMDGAQIIGAELGRVAVVTDGRYFVWDGSTLTEPTGGAFTSFGPGAFFAEYVVLPEKNGRRLLWTDLADSKTLPALNFATAESTDDNILRIISLNGRLMVFKESVIEVWAQGFGQGADAFARLDGGVIPKGLLSADLVAEFDGGAMFVGSDGVAYMTTGGAPQAISTPAVNTSIDQSTVTHCYSYEDEGTTHCVLRFSDRPAWVYNIATTEWHERASLKDDPWGITCAGKAYGNFYGGNADGELVQFAQVNEDAGQPLIKTGQSSTIYNNGQRFRVAEFELTGRTGEGTSADFGETWSIEFPDGRTFFNPPGDLVIPGDAVHRVSYAPTDRRDIALRFSGDGGKTWSPEVKRDFGGLGEYDRRCVINRLGQYRRFTVEVSTSEAITMDCAMNVRIA